MLSENQVLENNLTEENIKSSEMVNLSPEDQFQSAFDNIRDKNWE